MIKLQRYLRVLSVVDILVFIAVVISCAVTEKYVCKLKPIPIPFLKNGSNGTEGFQPQNTIWDYRVMLLTTVQEYGPEAYHAVYVLIVLFAMLYFVMEIWLFCVLTKGINQKRPEFCTKWINWRIFILAITLVASGFHMSQLQMTCTDAIIVPFSIFRITSIFFVCSYLMMVTNSSSKDSIIMTGSEKL